MSAARSTILLVEDDENDAFFMQRTLQKAGIEFPVQVVTHGRQALDYLEGVGPFKDRAQYPLPAIICLDLKLPFVGGFELLAWIRADAFLQQVPVFILTSSSEDRDRQRAAELGAKAYFVKPPTPEIVMEMVRFLEGKTAFTSTVFSPPPDHL
jgi:DNA-binding response OmpR family regulator